MPEPALRGLPGHEGAFLLCSLWLVDNHRAQGRVAQAHDLYGSLCARAGELGLLPEEIDPPRAISSATIRRPSATWA